MNQLQSIAVALSDASAVLQERSNDKKIKMPLLTIMTPYRSSMGEEPSEPPTSVRLFHGEVMALRNMLNDYYSEIQNVKPT
jgi:hypothetical protein